MSRHPLLTQLLEDELDRAPLLWQEVLAAAQDSLRAGEKTLLPAQRQHHVELQRRLEAHAGAAAGAFLRALRVEATAELERGESPRAGDGQASLPPSARVDLPDTELSLVGEDEVAADVAMSRVIEAAVGTAEQELRDLTALVCALLGDRELARPCNPLRPEVYARALWAGAQAAELPQAQAALLLQQLATPLARALRLGYAEACRRLDDTGVEPAAFRTLVLPGGPRGRLAAEEAPATDLQQLMETLPAPLDEEQVDLPLDAPSSTPPTAAAAAAQRAQLMARLFETIARDSRLTDELAGWIERLQPGAVALARADATLIDEAAHPLWQFVDRLVFDAEVVAAPASTAAFSRLAERLVEHVAAQPAPSAAAFAWALERLAAFERHALGQRCQALQEACDSLRSLESRLDATALPPRSGDASPLDVATLDTVPAALMSDGPSDAAAPGPEAARWVASRRPGELLRVFLQGRWVLVQWLWTSDGGAYLLLQDPFTLEHWALRRQALQRLRSEGLASVSSPPSRVQAAAARLWQQLGPAPD